MKTTPGNPPARKPLRQRAAPARRPALAANPPHPDSTDECRDTAKPPAPDSGTPEEPVPQQLLYTTAQAAALLQVPASWLRKKSAAGLIPHTRLGRHIRYSEADLASIIRNGARAPRQ